MDFCVVTVYSLFAELDKRVAEARRLDLFEHNVGICFDRIRTELDTVVFLWSCRRYRRGRFRSQSRFYIHPESIHALAVLREPVHNVAVVAGDAQLRTLTVANDVLLRKSILLAEIDAKLHGFLVTAEKYEASVRPSSQISKPICVSFAEPPACQPL